eukprot:3172847-Pleurochrysis_carterae.AAC.1
MSGAIVSKSRKTILPSAAIPRPCSFVNFCSSGRNLQRARKIGGTCRMSWARWGSTSRRRWEE